MPAYFEAKCLLPHDRRRSWATVRAATARGLLAKLGGDASLTRCYKVSGATRTRIDLVEGARA